MAKRGLMTEKERTLMVNSQVSATSRHNVVLMWLFRTAIDARKAGKVIYPYVRKFWQFFNLALQT